MPKDSVDSPFPANVEIVGLLFACLVSSALQSSIAMSAKQDLTSESQLTPASLRGAVTHMNKDHVHNMTNIVQAYCNLSRPPTNVQMTAMDFEGFECTFVTTPGSLWGKGSYSDSRGVRIPWTRGTISDAKDARVELVALSEQSEKKVGKVSRSCAPSASLLDLSNCSLFNQADTNHLRFSIGAAPLHPLLGVPLLPRDRCTNESQGQSAAAFVRLLAGSKISSTDDNHSALNHNLQSACFGSALDALTHRLPCKWESRDCFSPNGLGVGIDRSTHRVSYFWEVQTPQPSRQV